MRMRFIKKDNNNRRIKNALAGYAICAGRK
jgi:hypothetical protein